jgi:hypothetical protein
MNWKDLFKEYPIEWTKYAMMGMVETLRGMLLLSKVVDKDRLIEIMKDTLKGVEKDLEEIRKEEK